MSRPQVKIVNTQTGEEIIRDATAEEIAQMAKDAQETSEREAEAEARAAQKAALLDRLGITEEEAKLLLA